MTALSKTPLEQVTDLQPDPLEGRDRRRFRRIPLALNGRFLDARSEEHTLITRDISCAGSLVMASHTPEPGEPIVCYFDDLGRVAGHVVRKMPGGFALAFQTTPHKRDKIVDKLTWLWNKDRLDVVDEREDRRYHAEGPAVITLADGRALQCRVIDISLTGAGLVAVNEAPTVGELIRAGNLKARVVRREGRSFGIRFIGKVREAD